MKLIVVVARRPYLTALVLKVHRSILYGRHQVIAPRLLQRRQVDRRLDQRSDGPHRVQRPVETRFPRLAPAHHRQHLGRADSGEHYCALQRARSEPRAVQLQLTNSRGQRRLRPPLQ